MKICYLALANVIHTQRWVKYFAEKGHDVHLISPVPWEFGAVEQVKFHRIKKWRLPVPVISLLLDQLTGVIQVMRLVRRIKPDIIHAHYISSSGFWAALSGFHPFVLTVWGPDILVWPRKSRLLRWITRFVLRRIDLATCNGENVLEEMVRLGAQRNKIRLIHNGVDTQKFNPERRDGMILQGLGISGSPVIISLRRLFPLLDVESLVRAIPMVLEQVPRARFIIAGDGPQKKYLVNLAASLNISDSIRWVGVIPHDQLPVYLASADIYVSTALSDATSVSLLEAMACNLPVIVTDSGDNRKWVEDGTNGFIVPVKTPEKLAQKIVYLLENDDVRIKFAQSNRRVVESRAHYGREMEKVENLYSELVEGVRKCRF